MKKSLPITKILQFALDETTVRMNGRVFEAFRYYPPNLRIMSEQEKKDEIERMGALFDALNCTCTLFATDKVENLSETRDFYNSMPVEYEYITTAITAVIEDKEVSSTAVQRAYYFIHEKQAGDNVDFYNTLVSKGYRVQPLQQTEAAVLLRNYLTREFTACDIYSICAEVDELPKMKKAAAAVREREIQRRLCPHRLDFGITTAEQNDFFRQTIMIKNLPAQISPCALMSLAALRNTSMTIHLTPLPMALAGRLINSQLNTQAVKKYSNKSTEQIEATEEERAIKDFYRKIVQERSTIYSVNIFIEFYAPSREALAIKKEEVTAEIKALQQSYESLRYEQKEAFESVQPFGHDCFLSNANNMPSRTVAALCPVSHSYRLDKHGMPLGRTTDGGLLLLDLMQRDSYITTGNYTITGQAGQGKSYLMKKMITFLRLRGCKCFLLDPEGEYNDLTTNLGGSAVDCAAGNIKINPFEVRRQKTAADETAAPDGLAAQWNMPVFYQHLSWLTDFFRVLFPSLGDRDLKALMIIVQDLYEQKGIDERSNFACLTPQDYPVFSELYAYISDHTQPGGYKMISYDIMQTLQLYLRDCALGSLSVVLDGHTNLPNADFISFDLCELLQGSEERTRAVLFNIATYVWNIISGRESEVMMNVDELHLFLTSPYMRKYLCSYAKRSRKYNAILGIGTQQLADCLNPEYAADTTALFNNSSFKFLFYPGEIDYHRVQEALSLSEGEMRCISISNKRHCLIKAGNDKYYAEIGALPYEQWLFGNKGGV